MKYLSAKFVLTGKSGSLTDDEMLLQTAKDILCESAGEAGFEAFEDSGNIVTGYVQTRLFDKEALDCRIGSFPMDGVEISYSIEEAEDRNWNEAWEEGGFEPIMIKDKYVIHDRKHPVTCQEGMRSVVIDTKQAFGTGSHETTYMIAGELAGMDLTGKTVLDCGCGTGILSIISALCGAESVTAYDIDEWSVDNTRHNCGLNGVTNVETYHGDSGVIGQSGKSFDIVLANINRNILLADMPRFRSAMSRNSLLILSGFYEEDAPMLIDKAQGMGLLLVKSEARNGWCMLVLS